MRTDPLPAPGDHSGDSARSPIFRYIVPVHNEEKLLPATVDRLVYRLAAHPGSEVVLGENGSRDRSWEVAQRLSTGAGPVPVSAYGEARAGMGYGYQRALEEALVRLPPAADLHTWFVLTAADLPFDFSDLDSFLAALAEDATCPAMIGSKAHPSSRTGMRGSRSVLSAAYRVMRFALLGMRTADSQGSVFVRADVMRRLAPLVASRDFFYSSELVCLMEWAGVPPREIPVVLAPEKRPSTVRPLRDGRRMLRQALKLRKRRSSLMMDGR